MKKKNTILAIVQKEDPHRYRTRTVKSEKGKGKKDRPRNKKVDVEGDSPLNNIYIGAHVVDLDAYEGIVVKIEPGYDVEEHGTVFVWQLNRVEYGIDNCEHYPFFEWHKSLKILK